MNPRERFNAVLNGRKPDRLPMVEWAAWWWDRTIQRWTEEGLPEGMNLEQSLRYFGLDELHCPSVTPHLPPAKSHGAGIIKNERDYENIIKEHDTYSNAHIERFIANVKTYKERHDRGEISLRVWLDGFFWYPRKLFGIEPHLYAFYDYPELLERINSDLEEFNMRVLLELFKVLKPEFIGYGEDMSYNHGPMLSVELFEQFIAPHYKPLTKFTRENGVKTLIDTDGDLTVMIPWLTGCGADGVYPLERQAGIDLAAIRGEYPELILLGGYDKMVMSKGEAAIRAEFERLLPVMRSGYYIPSVDHQTPPEVSLEDYKIYIKLFKEYCQKAAE
ncbi:MAG: hypothetical protein FWH24_03760 [Oscillospiraceae bacterium]|nr:hypothetical protein [Oscillospiraceae bacterium]